MADPITPEPNAPNPNAPEPNAPAPGSTDPRLGTIDFKIPEQYASEPWAQTIKDPQALWDQMANAQTLIGKKGIIPPGENATPEEIKAYRVAQGMPELPEGYAFTTIEALKDQQRSEEMDNKVKNIMHKHGVPKSVGEGLFHDLEQMMFDAAKPKMEQIAVQEKGWAELKKQTFGESSDIVSEGFKNVLVEALGDKNKHLAGKLNSMDNESLATLMVFSKQIHDTYVGESKIKLDGGTPLGQDLQSQFQSLSSEKLRIKAEQNMTKTVKDQKLAEINRKMMEIGNQAAEKEINLFAIK
jgi:hypothetical protein